MNSALNDDAQQASAVAALPFPLNCTVVTPFAASAPAS
jgi:hypothetical protein